MNEHHNTDHNGENDDLSAFEAQLADRIHDSVVELPPAKGAHAAVDRATARSRHRRGVLVGAAAVALVAGVVGTTVIGDDDSSPLDTAGTMSIDDDGVDLDWRVSDDGLSYVRSHAASEAGLYAMSTAPGTRHKDFPDGNIPRAMYRLADDGTWHAIDLGDDGPAPGRISERAGTLYALSTGADTGQPMGSMSADGGETWTTVPLGTIEPPSDDLGWGMHYSLDLASTGDVTFGLVTAQFHFPADEIFPELNGTSDEDGADMTGQNVIDDSVYFWDFVDEGVELHRVTIDHQASGSVSDWDDRPDDDTIPLDGGEVVLRADGEPADDERELVRTVPWADLGLDGAADLEPRTTAYLVDEEAWTEVGAPVEPGPGHGTSLAAAGDHLVLTQRAWDETNPEGGTATVHHSPDGVDWVSADALGTGTVAASPIGLVRDRGPQPTDDGALQASTDLGTTWHDLDLTSVDPRIGELGPDANVQAIGGPLGVGALINDFDEEGSGTSLLAFSTDLTSWTVTDLREISPDSRHFSGAIVGTDRIVVHGTGEPGTEDEPGTAQTLIATPTR